MNTWLLVAETKEWVGPIVVTESGTPVASFEVAVASGSSRPSAWASADVNPGGGTSKGVIVGLGTDHELAVGIKYTIYVRWTDGDETPVLKAGYIKAI